MPMGIGTPLRRGFLVHNNNSVLDCPGDRWTCIRLSIRETLTSVFQICVMRREIVIFMRQNMSNTLSRPAEHVKLSDALTFFTDL